MSSSTNDSEERTRISKVTFAPISSEALIVRIRTMSAEERKEDIPQSSSAFQPIPRNSDAQNETIGHIKSTMSRNPETVSSASQTVQKHHSDLHIMDSGPSSSPCLKHAAQNISRKASDIPTEKINLCNSCSKSMLSYIFLVQDFLDSLAKEISGDDSSHCLQCARQEVRDCAASASDNLASSHKNIDSSSEERVSQFTSDTSHSRIESKISKDGSGHRTNSKRTSRVRNYRQDSKRSESSPKNVSNTQNNTNKQSQQVDFLYNVSSSNVDQYPKNGNIPSVSTDTQVHFSETGVDIQNFSQYQSVSSTQYSNQQQSSTNYTNISQQTVADCSNLKQYHGVSDHERGGTQTDVPKSQPPVTSSDHHFQASQQINEQLVNKFRSPMERVQPNYDTVPPAEPEQFHENDHNNNIPVQHSPTLFRDDVDGIISTLSNAEREIYDSARNRAGWESLTETQERLPTSASNLIPTEAFVTSCRNNAEAIGCLVVGTSLLLCRTTRTLCVLVSDGVSTAFRGALSAVFQVVQNVRSLDSLGTTKLALIEQPELGITFEKLNIWRLSQFKKCVYLNPDTLVLQDCDELFSHEELSAVPDIGWPDCFNSGVFVFVPSELTFWQLMEFAEKQGSYDGGDQGLLNSYFHSWSSDINHKLSFIYNLMANVSYTYTPAFRQFGRNVKIVQFHGSFKPWHVKFFPGTSQISPSSPVHPTYAQFVHIWLKIFSIRVLRLMSQEIQSYASSQETICAVEILRFFPLPTESEAEFFLTPPSVRVRLAEKKLAQPSSLQTSEARRRQSAEVFRYTPKDETASEVTSSQGVASKDTETSEVEDFAKSVATATDTNAEDKVEDSSIPESDEVFKEKEVTTKVKGESTLPGAEVGDYQGMKAWEQGRIDYEGTDSSDNVIKRLQFLMSRPK